MAPRTRGLVRRAIVLGGPGSGKSFLTQTTGLDLARAALDSVQQQRAGLDAVSLPIHLTLASFARPDLPRDPAAAVMQLLNEELKPTPYFLAWLEQRLCAPSTWLLLDALDEVEAKDHKTLDDRLRALDGQRWQTRLLLTCRPANWSREHVPWTQLTEYELAPLNPLEIRQFVGRWYAADNERGVALSQALDRNYPLAHAARTPLISTFLCLAHEETPVSASTRRTELYARVLRGLARRAWKKESLPDEDPHADDLVDFLVAVARPLFELHPSGNLFTRQEIMRVLRMAHDRPPAWLEGKRQPNTPINLRDELRETGILVGAGRPVR